MHNVILIYLCINEQITLMIHLIIKKQNIYFNFKMYSFFLLLCNYLIILIILINRCG